MEKVLLSYNTLAMSLDCKHMKEEIWCGVKRKTLVWNILF